MQVILTEEEYNKLKNEHTLQAQALSNEALSQYRKRVGLFCNDLMHLCTSKFTMPTETEFRALVNKHNI